MHSPFTSFIHRESAARLTHYQCNWQCRAAQMCSTGQHLTVGPKMVKAIHVRIGKKEPHPSVCNMGQQHVEQPQCCRNNSGQLLRNVATASWHLVNAPHDNEANLRLAPSEYPIPISIPVPIPVEPSRFGQDKLFSSEPF